MNIRLFLRNHQDGALIVVTTVFLVVIVGLFVWGITALVITLNAAMASGGGGSAAAVGFRLDEANKILSEHGLQQ
jgi:hypothetical protein